MALNIRQMLVSLWDIFNKIKKPYPTYVYFRGPSADSAARTFA